MHKDLKFQPLGDAIDRQRIYTETNATSIKVEEGGAPGLTSVADMWTVNLSSILPHLDNKLLHSINY